MGDRTKIDWCDASWNPVTGCLHGCEYCYARRIAERFGGNQMPVFVDYPILREPYFINGRKQPYPFDFTPTFHKYKLDEPQKWKKPRTIFVCSMADLFGEWVPDEWISDVLNACRAAPQHRYLFLTKNPQRYIELRDKHILPTEIDCWWGASATRAADKYPYGRKTFVSIEPILEDFSEAVYRPTRCGWVIIGAETGNRKGKVIPKKEWIQTLADRCFEADTPVFMKESLRGIMGEDFRQEFPWEV